MEAVVGEHFELKEGEYAIVVINADASPGVNVELAFGIKASGLLLALGIIFLFIGLAALAAGLFMFVFGARSRPQRIPPPPQPRRPST